jgi:dolichyl-phosphate beta-glucosyltransferase
VFHHETRPYLSLIIPAYNEEARIVSTLNNVRDYLAVTFDSWNIVVVDDGSTDNTLSIMRQWAAENEGLRIVSYKPNVGKGYAVRQGVFAADGEFIAFSDADLSAPIEELAKLFDAVKKGYDIAIGSRAVKGASIPIHQPFYRELGGKGLNLIIQALAVPGICDTQCGFKLFRGDVAREIFSRCFVNKWGFDVEVLYLARRLGYSIAEIGVKWSHAEGSKIKPFPAALGIIRDLVRIRLHRYDL